jgi:crotonobetainyl-CoA:carnitine CoA-transferase CaiB-like acyl-CoA transferase
MDNRSASLPLQGVTVLDLTHVAAGPFCGSMLGQLGATVVKVEPLGEGEMMRRAAPFIGAGPISFYFACVNTEKEFVQIDLKSEKGKKVFLDLARQSDVVLQNMAPGVVKRLGVDYESLRVLRPDIIYCSISGFRPGSAYQDLPSFDYIHEAMAGVMSMTGYTGEAPPLPGLPAADMSASVYAVLSIVLALRVRDATGDGQNIEVPLQDCLMSLLPARIGYTYATGKPFPTFGAYHRDFAPFGVFKTRDAYLVITVGSEDLWQRVLVTFPELDLPEFKRQKDRIQNREALYAFLRDRFAGRTTREWLDAFRATGVPAAPVMDTAEVAADPYVQEITETLELKGGSYTWHRFPVQFNTIRPRLGRAPGLPGADTRSVLGRLGYSEKEVDVLLSEGVIGAAKST